MQTECVVKLRVFAHFLMRLTTPVSQCLELEPHEW